MTTPDTAPKPPAFELAKILAHSLARVEKKPAYVINDDNHCMIAVDLDIGEDGLHYWTPEQIIFVAPAPEGA